MVADRSSRMVGLPGESGRHRRWMLWEQQERYNSTNNYKNKNKKQKTNNPTTHKAEDGILAERSACIRMFSPESVSHATLMLARRNAGRRPLRDR
jgi:hypothetical protein